MSVPGSLTIKGLQFRAGASANALPEAMHVGRVTILVGPNDAGKSTALREVERWCKGEEVNLKVIDQIDLDLPTDATDAEMKVRRFEARPRDNDGTGGENAVLVQHFVFQDVRPGMPTGQRIWINLNQLASALEEPSKRTLRQLVSRFYTVLLDGKARLTLVEPKPGGNRRTEPENHLQALAKDPSLVQRVNQYINKAFSRFIALDLTNIGDYGITVHTREPTPIEELSANDAGLAYHEAGSRITELGDGVKCFAGLIIAMLSLPHKVILIDEPEAFLHPPHARRLGTDLVEIAGEREATLIIATHSPYFLFGCIEAAREARIIRLTYREGVATARSLQVEQTSLMIQDPFMRSTDVLGALFHQGAVVAEGDADRAFYNEVNRQLDSKKQGIIDAVFLNARGKDVVPRIVKPLRDVGVPAAAVLDLDAIENPQKFEDYMTCCNIPRPMWQALEQQRIQLLKAYMAKATVDESVYSATGREATREQQRLVKYIERNGLDGLEKKDKKYGEEFLYQLAEYGLFLLPVGVYENWLTPLGWPEKGAKLLGKYFLLIASTNADPMTLLPIDAPIWRFMNDIAHWISNPTPLGLG